MKNNVLRSCCCMGIIVILCMFSLGDTGIVCAAQRPIVAVIRSRNIGPYNQALKGFKEQLIAHNIKPILSYYDLEGVRGREKELLAEARDMDPDIVLAIGTEAASLCKDYFTQKPVVFSMVLDSVEGGITDSVEPSGTNITGVILAIPIKVQLKTLKEFDSGIKTVGMLYDANTREKRINEVNAEMMKLGLQLIAEPVEKVEDFPKALERVVEKADALWAEVDGVVYNPQTAREIILATFKGDMPFMAFSSPYVKAGALLCLQCDYVDIGKQSGEIAKRILEGTDPGTIPIAFPRKKDLIINVQTAETIGIEVPLHVRKKAVKIFGE
jgi:putative tryptophan/tyrosine transport system substrate-binding protein